MFNVVRILSFAVLSAAALTACSPTVSKSGSDENQTQSRSVDGLQGQWVSTCGDATFGGNSQRSELTVNGSKATRLTRVSASGSCSDTTLEVRQDALLHRGRQVGGGLYELDIKVRSISVRPMSATGVAIMNAGAGFCDYKNWQVGVERDVTRNTGTDHCYPEAPVQLYDVYSVEGDKLYFGMGNAVGDATIRASSLDRDDYYSKR